MGTNFYWRDSPCGTCGRYEEIHVGKRSAGWSFGFRAYPHRLMNAEHPDWGYDPESPFGFPVLSRVDWRRVFTERTGVLRDECGQDVVDPLAWLDELAAPDRAQQMREDMWRRSPDWYAEREWRDVEGFHFYAGEFA